MQASANQITGAEAVTVSVVLPGEAESRDVRASARRVYSRAVALFADGSDHSIARRVASTAFLIRVASAAVVFLTQVVLARWMGRFEFGVYVYVWTWVLLLGALVSLGLPSAAQRFIPNISDAASSIACAVSWSAAAGSPSGWHDRGRDRHRARAPAPAAPGILLLRPARPRLLVSAHLCRHRHPGRHRALVQLDRSLRSHPPISRGRS